MLFTQACFSLSLSFPGLSDVHRPQGWSVRHALILQQMPEHQPFLRPFLQRRKVPKGRSISSNLLPNEGGLGSQLPLVSSLQSLPWEFPPSRAEEGPTSHMQILLLWNSSWSAHRQVQTQTHGYPEALWETQKKRKRRRDPVLRPKGSLVLCSGSSYYSFLLCMFPGLGTQGCCLSVFMFSQWKNPQG